MVDAGAVAAPPPPPSPSAVWTATGDNADDPKPWYEHVPKNMLVFAGNAAVVGFFVGARRGARNAQTRYLAENAHRQPTTVKGWVSARASERARGVPSLQTTPRRRSFPASTCQLGPAHTPPVLLPQDPQLPYPVGRHARGVSILAPPVFCRGPVRRCRRRVCLRPRTPQPELDEDGVPALPRAVGMEAGSRACRGWSCCRSNSCYGAGSVV